LATVVNKAQPILVNVTKINNLVNRNNAIFVFVIVAEKTQMAAITSLYSSRAHFIDKDLHYIIYN